MITTSPVGLGVSIGFDLSDIKRTVSDAVADQADDIGKEVLRRLRPEIPGLVNTAVDTAIKRLEPKIPSLVNRAIEAARGKLMMPTGVKVAGVALVGVWVSAAVFSFLSWRRKR